MWTPETLAQAFHEAYGRVSPAFFGTQGNAPAWNEITEQSRNHLIAVCADVLGTPVEMPARKEKPDLEPVPERVEFQKAREVAPEENQDGLSDWESDLRRQIDEAARGVRGARKPFDGKVR
jgi:hypothetical protein